LPQNPKKSRKPQKGKPYKHPIPGPNDLIDFLTETGKPLKADAILKAFDLKGQRMRSLLVEKLNTMVRAGQIIENRRGEYCLTAKLDLVTGTVSGHRDGFGFVVRDDGESEDVYLSAREMRPLFDGDRVAIRVKGMIDAGVLRVSWLMFSNAAPSRWLDSLSASVASAWSYRITRKFRTAS